jgi:hypothetical protein
MHPGPFSGHALDFYLDDGYIGKCLLWVLVGVPGVVLHDDIQRFPFLLQLIDERSLPEADHAQVLYAPLARGIRRHPFHVNVYFEANAVVLFEDIYLPALASRVEVQAVVLVAEADGNHIWGALIAQANPAYSGSLDDGFYEASISDLFFSSSHAGVSPWLSVGGYR